MAPSRWLAIALALGACAVLPAQDKPKPAVHATAAADDGFTPLFNGKNLDGWVNVNCHPGTFFVKDGEIITTGKPTGFLRTDRQYENFVLEIDWMHVNKKEVGNSGLFVWGDPLPAVGTGYTRGIEVQVLVNLEYKNKEGKVTATSHGDLFSIWGAKCVPDRPHPNGSERCLPSENRAKGGGEWNHYKVTGNNGVIKLEVNGKEVSGVSKCNPRKGYLALESEDAECHFKNIKIKELPSTSPKPEEIAKVAEGHVSLFNGLDLKGWETEEDAWKVTGGKLVTQAKNSPIIKDYKIKKIEVSFDWNLPKGDAFPVTCCVGSAQVTIVPRGDILYFWHTEKEIMSDRVENAPVKIGGWNRANVAFDGITLLVTLNGKQALKKELPGAKSDDRIKLSANREGMEIMNVFVRELKEKK